MKPMLIYSQVTAVLELNFLHRLQLLTNLKEVHQKLATEVSQTCMLHTLNPESWIIQGSLEDVIKAHQVFTVIANCIFPVKRENQLEVTLKQQDLVVKKGQTAWKSPFLNDEHNLCSNESRIEESPSRFKSSNQVCLQQNGQCIEVNPTSELKKKQKKKTRRKNVVGRSKKLNVDVSLLEVNEDEYDKGKEEGSEATPGFEILNKPSASNLSEATTDKNEKSHFMTENEMVLTDQNETSKPTHNQDKEINLMTNQCEEDDSIDITVEYDNNPALVDESTVTDSLCEVVAAGNIQGDVGDKENSKEVDGRKEARSVPTDLGCHLCTKTFTTSSNLSKHLKSAHLGIRFKCGFRDCHKSFTDKCALLRHYRRAHEGLQCSKCRLLCQSEQQLKNHAASCNEGPFQAMCVFCGKAYTSVSNLNKHVKFSHTGKKISCDLCSKFYKTPSSLRDHRENQHDLYDCTRCNTKDMQHKDFEVHMKEAHGKPFNVVGLGVEETTRQEPNTAVYIRQRRTRQPTDCSHCSKTFSSVSNMNHHVRRVHQKCREMCSKCGLSFSSHDHLKRHQKLAHETIHYPCSMCDKTYTNRLSLSKHQSEEHRQLSMDLTCQCEVCGRTFLYKCNLDRHIRTEHHKIRYQCDNCSREFSTKYARSEHSKSEHQGHRWLCQHCPYMFKFKHKLLEHVTLRHNDRPPELGSYQGTPTKDIAIKKMKKQKGCVSNWRKKRRKNSSSVLLSTLPEVSIGMDNMEISDKSLEEQKQEEEQRIADKMDDLTCSKSGEPTSLDHINTTNNEEIELLHAAALTTEHFVSSEIGFDCHSSSPLLNLSRADPEDILKSALESHGIVPEVTVTEDDHHFMPLDFHSALNMSVFKSTHDLQPSSIQDPIESSVYSSIVSPEPTTSSTDLPYSAFTNPDLFSREFL